jgi:hypothetical protein
MTEEDWHMARRGLTAGIPIWVRVPGIIALVLVGVLVSTMLLGAAGDDGGHGAGDQMETNGAGHGAGNSGGHGAGDKTQTNGGGHGRAGDGGGHGAGAHRR